MSQTQGRLTNTNSMAISIGWREHGPTECPFHPRFTKGGHFRARWIPG